MPQILVATDFSDVSENAVHYACRLAQDFNASVTVMHSFIIPVTFSDTPMPVMPVDEGRKIAEERMTEIIAKLQQSYPKVAFNSKIMFGDIIDCIEEYSEDVLPWLIVVGNSGSGDNTLWLGSNALSALRNLKHIVLAIPPEAIYRKPEKLCFACDLKNVTEHLETDKLLTLVQQTGAQLHILNIDHHNKNNSLQTPSEGTDLHLALSAITPLYHFVEKDNVEEGIEEFVAANRMDWLIILPHKHSFFEGLFHKSHTKAIMKMAHIPLVALHEK